jgi:DNA end-binding protein Ku
MPPRAIWTGSINFGLVNVPVKVVTAVRHKEIKFNMLHEKDGARINQKRVCAKDGEPVPAEEVVKGYMVRPDEYVMITPNDLAGIMPEKSETIDIMDFVDHVDIDPIYYEQPYYLVPAKGGTKAYHLLVEAMARTNRVAIAQFVMREKEHLVALRVIGDTLCMTTLVYHDEVVPREELEDEEAPRVGKPLSDKEIEMAEQLVSALVTEFKPEKYKDTYRARVMEMIEAKAEGKTFSSPKKAPGSRPADLVAALKASIDAAKTKQRDGSVEV